MLLQRGVDAPARGRWCACGLPAGGEESIPGEQADGGALLLLGPGPGGLGHLGPAQEPVDRAEPHTVSGRKYFIFSCFEEHFFEIKPLAVLI